MLHPGTEVPGYSIASSQGRNKLRQSAGNWIVRECVVLCRSLKEAFTVSENFEGIGGFRPGLTEKPRAVALRCPGRRRDR